MLETFTYRANRLIAAQEQPEVLEHVPDPDSTANTLGGIALTFLIGHSIGLGLGVPVGGSEAFVTSATTVEPTAYIHTLDALTATVEYADRIKHR